jgi:hypothetical protein
MRINGKPAVVLLTLTQSDAEWRISDVAESGIQSLVKFLGGDIEPLVFQAELKWGSPVVKTTTWKPE